MKYSELVSDEAVLGGEIDCRGGGLAATCIMRIVANASNAVTVDAFSRSRNRMIGKRISC